MNAVGLLKKNALPFLLAITIGASMVASLAFFRGWIGDGYRGIDPVLSPVTQDGAWYYALVEEAMEGGMPWHAALFEGKTDPYPIPDLAERILAFPGRVFGWSAQATLLFWRFVLPALLTCVIFFVTERATGSRELALFSSTTSVLFAPVLYPLLHFVQTLLGWAPSLPFTIYDRPVHPQFEAPFIWLFLFFATTAVLGSKRRWNAVAAALIFGLLAHTYFWAWTFCLAALTVLFVIACIRRSRAAVLTVAGMELIGLLIAAPKIAALVTSAFLSGNSSYAERLATFSGHAFASWTFNLPIVMALAAFLWRRRFASLGLRIFVAAGLGGSFIALNQQVATGVSIQPDHYVGLITASFVLWVLAWIFWTFTKEWRLPVRRAAFAGIVLAGFVMTFVFQYRSYLTHREYTAALQPFSEVAAWLNTHAESQSVVFANQQTGLLVPIFAHQNLWWHFYALATPVPEDRIEHAAFTWFWLLGLEPSDLRAAAEQQPLELSQYFTLTTIFEQRLEFIRRQIDGIVARYESFRATRTLPEALRAYRADFILVDRKLDTWDPERLGAGREVFRNERFILLALFRP
ncbi:hypothetical protein HY479_02915 [Candidatus Uhrbacteria bacterium]|nr:hypothetical protein [Candidatus Uhrbacteria bacterium]